MNVKEVANCLMLHPNTVYRLCKNGDIPSIKFGTTIRIKKEDLNSYLSDK
ncbi:helix-turn-helix domain-containing protein [Gammaproteobacteria bacterium]|nr:helix-turn-helix domain-containing protein [Gammaproteobacteria bacterium]